MSETALRTVDVSCVFEVSQGFMKGTKPLRAVNGVSLNIPKGRVVGLVGESGCGKSTMANILLGLQKPTSGDVMSGDSLYYGQQTGYLDRKKIARRIQPIFQDPYSSLNPTKTIHSIVCLPLRIHNIGDPSKWDKKVYDILDLVGLPKRVAQSYPSQMSGGQRQRVAIARALIMKPEVVICDEPTSALDVSVQSQILNLLQDLRQELGLTYLLISHNLAVVEHMADRVAVMYLGRIVEEADANTLFDDPRHPYTKALLGSVLTPDPSLGVPDTHLGTVFPNPIDPPSGCSFHPRCSECMDICSKKAPKPSVEGGRMIECHRYQTNEAEVA
ncbi:ABC transporter ATP-binding protein [Thioalkalivibrio sp. HK1]|uniref:ABC transporter ATP-binding protein n=1 Tax=Thioalkalivibrio sp. HK1 TaxID=1469245 RepID=UPI00046F25F4|nr:ABC transporter ATP-binding protein [Thioalkalivibrio sp. HK1]